MVQKTKTFFRAKKIKILMIGIGGGGASILKEIARNLQKINFLIADTDERSFKKLPYLKAFRFGQNITRGWGTGMNPEVGEKVALEVKDKIKKLLEGFDLVILLSCLGGGVGSGASPVFSQILKEQKKLSLGIFTLPFNFEGEKKTKIAQNALQKLRENLSGIIILPNEQILKISEKKTSLKKSLSLMNQILIGYLADLIEMINLAGLVNIDFADFRTTLKGKNQLVCFGRGIAQGANRAEEALKQLFEGPFFNPPPKIKKILFNIASGENLALKEVEKIAERISKLNPRAKIIFGLTQNSKLNKKIKITLLIVGEEKLVKREKKQTFQEKKPEKKEKKEKKESKKKVKIRRSALEVKKTEKETEEREWWQEEKWEVPTFLRRKIK